MACLMILITLHLLVVAGKVHEQLKPHSMSCCFQPASCLFQHIAFVEVQFQVVFASSLMTCRTKQTPVDISLLTSEQQQVQYT